MPEPSPSASRESTHPRPRWRVLLAGITLLIVIVVTFVILGRISRDRPVPGISDTTMVIAPNRPVTREDVVVEQDGKGVYHLYLKDLVERESHEEIPLRWKTLRAKSDLSVSLPRRWGESEKTFRFKFGSIERQLSSGEWAINWFSGDGTLLDEESLKALADQQGVRLDKWFYRTPKEPIRLKLVGGFEGVPGGFLAGSHLFERNVPEPVAEGSGMHPSHKSMRQYTTLELPRSTLDDLWLTVDLSWGDEVISLPPEVGAQGSFEEFSAELVFLEELAMGSANEHGQYDNAFELGERRVPCSTAAFFFSKPWLASFVYPKFISKSGQEEVRYFLSLPDIRSTSMPIARDDLERIELHYRNQRRRVVFSLDHLPLPGVPATD